MHSRRWRYWRLIRSNVSEISIVSSWALTDVFRCEYQPRRWWISPFSFNLVTDSYRALWWCQSCSPSSLPSEHKRASAAAAAEYRASGVKWSLQTPWPRWRRWSSSEIRVTRPWNPSLHVGSEGRTFCQERSNSGHDYECLWCSYLGWNGKKRKWEGGDLQTPLNRSKIGLIFQTTAAKLHCCRDF